MARLLSDVWSFAWHNKAWWLVPLVLVLLVIGALIVSGQAVAPFIYTLF
ncbi:MAG TPA: DUF5989 family protein [Candidatus Krumholzibacteria bacterium]|nr:DUF5989 family protein [Candidatus Krumholzibacteria bacterium]HRX49905.1 DUF5989 family protein [Candidatus Krumholzibacteria bacterium]